MPCWRCRVDAVGCEALPLFLWPALKRTLGRRGPQSFCGFPGAASSLEQEHAGGSSNAKQSFCAQSATAKERVPVLLVVAPANGRLWVSILVNAKNVTAVADGVAMYVAAVVKLNHVPLSLLLLQAL